MSKNGGYVDLFVLPLPRRNLAKYKKMAQWFANFVKKHNVLDYREFLSDDLHAKGMTPFTKDIKLKTGEGLVGSYVLYRNKAHRDRVNKAMQKDPAMANMPKDMPFDMKRMLYGGFKTIVQI